MIDSFTVRGLSARLGILVDDILDLHTRYQNDVVLCFKRDYPDEFKILVNLLTRQENTSVRNLKEGPEGAQV